MGPGWSPENPVRSSPTPTRSAFEDSGSTWHAHEHADLFALALSFGNDAAEARGARGRRRLRPDAHSIGARVGGRCRLAVVAVPELAFGGQHSVAVAGAGPGAGSTQCGHRRRLRRHVR